MEWKLKFYFHKQFASAKIFEFQHAKLTIWRIKEKLNKWQDYSFIIFVSGPDLLHATAAQLLMQLMMKVSKLMPWKSAFIAQRFLQNISLFLCLPLLSCFCPTSFPLRLLRGANVNLQSEVEAFFAFSTELIWDSWKYIHMSGAICALRHGFMHLDECNMQVHNR